MTDSLNTEVSAINFAASLDTRIAYERAKVDSQMSDSNYKKLEKARVVVAHATVVQLMTESSVNVDFANRSLVSNSRMNVYTVEKVANALSFAASAARLNDYTRFILATAKKLSDASLTLTRNDAKDACSAHRKIADKSRKAFIVQNVEIKDDSTVNAQHASSLDALLTLNVLTKSYDANNQECYTLNSDNAIAKAMLSRIA